jgi:hypothetical protein
MRLPLAALLLTLATPALAINPSYKTWTGDECQVIATGELVPCTKWMLADIDRDIPAVSRPIVFPPACAPLCWSTDERGMPNQVGR